MADRAPVISPCPSHVLLSRQCSGRATSFLPAITPACAGWSSFFARRWRGGGRRVDRRPNNLGHLSHAESFGTAPPRKILLVGRIRRGVAAGCSGARLDGRAIRSLRVRNHRRGRLLGVRIAAARASQSVLLLLFPPCSWERPAALCVRPYHSNAARRLTHGLAGFLEATKKRRSAPQARSR